MAKLVEILAQRLLAWPEMAVIAVQDADGELKFSEDSIPHIDSQQLVWVRGGALAFREDGRIGEVAEDYRTAIVTRAEWQAAVDALYPKLVVDEEWNGVGLPPVGTVCELIYQGCEQGRVEVIFCSRQTTVCRNLEDDREQFGETFDYEFRPIRTPEQIAEDERAAGIESLRQLLSKAPFDDYYAAAAVYDAGYRKQEPK